MKAPSTTISLALSILYTTVTIMSSPGDAFASAANSSNNHPAQHPPQNLAQEGRPETSKSELLQLSAGDPNDDNVKSLKMGESLKLDNLGPIIINTDGTTRTIDNWDTLTEREREVSWRRIAKRNAERRVILEQKQKELDQQQQTEE
jgi:hypothetical protein